MNFVYYAILKRLEHGAEGQGDPRADLDRRLGVGEWPTPLRPLRAEAERQVNIDGETFNAPAWWRGDEDASQSFLAAMGVSPT